MQFTQSILKKIIKGLYVITDIAIQQKYSHAELAELAILGGAEVIQYRSKETNKNDLIEQAAQTLEVCRSANIPLLINDHVWLCKELDANGVHLGLNDMPIIKAREILGNEKIIGATARNLHHCLLAAESSANYVGLGPIYSTNTKIVESNILTNETIQDVLKNSPIPVVAISGIKISNAKRLVDMGFAGIAVVSAVCSSQNVTQAAKDFSALFH